MPVEIRYSGETVRVYSSSGHIRVLSKPLSVSVKSGILTASGDVYEGTYVITPTTSEQSMATRHKMMADDVTVHAIPYFETSNDSGGITISIAS